MNLPSLLFPSQGDSIQHTEALSSGEPKPIIARGLENKSAWGFHKDVQRRGYAPTHDGCWACFFVVVFLCWENCSIRTMYESYIHRQSELLNWYVSKRHECLFWWVIIKVAVPGQQFTAELLSDLFNDFRCFWDDYWKLTFWTHTFGVILLN